MNSDFVKEKLIEVLVQIQADSGLACPKLTGETKPTKDIPKFDSKIWPVATTILADEIGVHISNDVNLFYDKTTKLCSSIDEIVVVVSQLLKKQTERAVGA